MAYSTVAVATTFVLLALAASTSVVNASCPSSIDSFHADITQQYNGVSELYKWTFSLTSPIDDPPPGASSCGEVAYISQYGSSGECASTVQSKTGVNPSSDGCNYMFHDAIRLATVSLTCDAGASKVQMASTVSVNDAAGGKFEYLFSGKYAGVCGGGGNDDGDGSKSSGGCGGGCVFVIIFFVGAVLYVAGTVAFNYFKQGKRGKELAPHPEFWLLIPGLIKDGAMFSFQMITKPCRKDAGGSTYTQV